MFKSFVLSLFLSVQAFATIAFHPGEFNPFEVTHNVLLYTGTDYDRRAASKNEFLLSSAGRKEALEIAPAKLQLGYMYGELFASGGLGYFDAKNHKVYPQVMALRLQKKYEDILSLVTPHINENNKVEKNDITARWNASRDKNVYQASENIKTFPIDADFTHDMNILGFKDPQNRCVGILKIEKDPDTGINRKRKNGNEYGNLMAVAAKLHLTHAISEIMRFSLIMRNSFLALPTTKTGTLEPFYSLNAPEGVEDKDAITLEVGSSKAGNIIPKLYKNPIQYKNYVDEESLGQAALLSYVLGVPHLNDDNFITEWNPARGKFTTRLVSFDRACTLSNKKLAKSRQPGKGLHHFLDYFISNPFIEDAFVKHMESLEPLVYAYTGAQLQEESKIDNLFQRMILIKSVFEEYKQENKRITYRDLIQDILHEEEINFASQPAPSHALQLDSEPFKGNWSEAFQTNTPLGPIVHTPQATQLGFFSCGGNITMHQGSNFNGYVFQKTLSLKTNSTREEFVAALKAAGMYAGN